MPTMLEDVTSTILPNTIAINHVPVESPKLTTLYILLSVDHTIHCQPMILNIRFILVYHMIDHECRLIQVSTFITFNLVPN